MLWSDATYNIAVDFGDGVVKDGLELVTGCIFCDVNVLEIAAEAIVGESDQSRTDRHEPHLKMLKTLHLGEVITPQIIDLPSFPWVCCIVTALIRIISMTRIIADNDHHVIVVLVLTLCHVCQSTLHSILHVLTPSTTKTIVTTTTCAIVFQSSSQLREVTCDTTVVIRLRPLRIVLVLNHLTHN